MVVFGFGAGLLVGVLSEEPELLAGHLRGESEAVEWATSERALTKAKFEVATTTHDDIPNQEARAGAADVERLPQVAASPAMRATDVPSVAPRSQAAPGMRSDRLRPWAIQVGAFAQEGAARKLSMALAGKGYPTQVLSAEDSAGRWRVRVQPIAGEDRAQEIASELKGVERLPTWVLPMEASRIR
jgi:cell division protein FtsN